MPVGTSLPTRIALSTGVDRYLDPVGGNNANNGQTEGTAWRTLDYAIANAPLNSTVHLVPGSYTLASNITRAANSTNVITFKGPDGFVVGGLTAKVVSNVYMDSATYLRFQNIDFDFSGPTDKAISVNVGTHHIELLNCACHDSQNTNLLISGSSNPPHDIHLIHPAIYLSGRSDPTSNLLQGLYIAYGHDIWVADPLIFENASYGMQVYPEAHDVLVTGGTVARNGLVSHRSGITVQGASPTSKPGNVTIRNTTLCFNGSYGLYSPSGSNPGTGHVADRVHTFGNADGGINAPSGWNITPFGAGDTGLELNPNPSVETNITGYQADSYVTATLSQSATWAAVGSKSMRVQWTDPSGADPNGWRTLTGTSGIPVVAGKTYRFQLDANLVAIPAGSVGHWMRVYWYDSSGTLLSLIAGPVYTGSGVKHMLGSFYAPAGAAFASIGFGCDSGTSGGTFDGYFDNISFRPAAELDPQFTNPASRDYSLKSTSPLIDQADDAYAFPSDVLGVARPKGAYADIGAFEYSPSGPTAPTPAPSLSDIPTPVPVVAASVERLTLDGLALSADPWLLGELDVTPPTKNAEWQSGADSDGAALVRVPRLPNREVKATVTITADDADAKLTAVKRLSDKLAAASLSEDGVPLEWVPANSTRRHTFYVLCGEITGIPVTFDSGYFADSWTVTLSMTCKPFAYGDLKAADTVANEVTNPKLQDNASGWGRHISALLNTGATTARVAGGPADYYLQVTTDGSDTAQGVDTQIIPPGGLGEGITWQASIEIHPDTAGQQLQIYVNDAVSNVTLVDITPPAGVWTRYTIEFTPDADVPVAYFGVRTGPAQNVAFGITRAVVVRGDSFIGYFDGDTLGYYWSNNPNASRTLGGGAVTSTGPLAVIPVPYVEGDAPAEGRLRLTDTSSTTRRYLEWGLESADYQADTDLFVDASSMVSSGYAGSANTRSGSVSTGVLRASLLGAAVPVCATPALRHVGTFRARARVYATANGIQVRVARQAGSGPIAANSWTQVPTTGWVDLDLGIVALGESPDVEESTLIVHAMSDAVGDTVDVDTITLVPVGEGYGVARATYVYQPGVVVAFDDFSSLTGNPLNGHVARSGATWATIGASPDFRIGSDAFFPLPGFPGHVTRDQPASDRRLGKLGSALTTQEATATIGMIIYGSGAGPGTAGGVLLRCVDTANYASARLDFISSTRRRLRIAVVVSSVETAIASLTVPIGVSSTDWPVVRGAVFESGFAIASVSVGGVEVGTVTGQHTALATGGALASGAAGIFDISDADDSYSVFKDVRVGVPSAEPIVLPADGAFEVRHDDVLAFDDEDDPRAPQSYRGSRLFLPPAGDAGRLCRIAARARQQDLTTSNDTGTGDSLGVEVLYTPRYLVVRG